jgi:hypothetical protein
MRTGAASELAAIAAAAEPMLDRWRSTPTKDSGRDMITNPVSLLSPSSEHLLLTVAAALPGGSVNVLDRAFRYLFVAGDGLDGAALLTRTTPGPHPR